MIWDKRKDVREKEGMNEDAGGYIWTTSRSASVLIMTKECVGGELGN